jgi:hypothetical protein
MENASTSPRAATPTYRVAAFADSQRPAVTLFTERARALSAEQWVTPRAPGKWAPYQEAEHLVLAYRAFGLAMRGERELEVQVTPERMQQLRERVLPRILSEDWFPTGARSLPEAVPTAEPRDRDTLLDELTTAAREFEATLLSAAARDAERPVRHPYFGPLLLTEFAIVAAAHTRHHAMFLPGVS